MTSPKLDGVSLRKCKMFSVGNVGVTALTHDVNAWLDAHISYEIDYIEVENIGESQVVCVYYFVHFSAL
jgi:hypothetical protein